MKATFVKKDTNSGRLIIFYNGWGCTESVISHIEGDYDVLMINEYNLDGKIPDVSSYKEINIVAWSMGVWYAACDDSLKGLNISNRIAINGTGSPIDDAFGIPTTVFEGTLKNLSPASLEKFSRRSCGTRENFDFVNKAPFRTFENIASELQWWYDNYKDATTSWTKVIVSTNDRIMTLQNQLNYWKNLAMDTLTIDAAHFNFEKFNSWDQILNY